MRLAVVSTPRSGNMWLRRLLVALYGLSERSAHTPAEVPWDELPARCAVQLHWRRTPAFVELLDRYGFRVVVLARHPLDVLLSILHFAPHEPATARWLDGEGGDESSILGVLPTSRAFRKYALGPRAEALLSVSPQWWDAAAARLRYEDLVGEPIEQLSATVAALGSEPLLSVQTAFTEVRFDALQAEAANRHFWRGRAGHWRDVISLRLAQEIAAAHPEPFERFGYDVDGVRLRPRQARATWRSIAVPPSGD